MTARAVVGGGISGLTAAYVLGRDGPVTLFEADDRLGGHAHTHTVASHGGATRRVDSGFIVLNDHTYPLLLRLFAELDIPTAPTDMSFSVHCDGCGLEYSGSQGLGGVFAQPRRLLSPRHLRMLVEVRRFHREARRVLDGAGDDGLTWGEFLHGRGFSRHFVHHFAIPFVSCVWSCGHDDAARYPARHLFRFLDHHRMLEVARAQGWRTVVGGSATYVDRLAARLDRSSGGEVRQATPVVAVARHADGVDVRTADGIERTFDEVVVATHADDALTLLVDADPDEKADLAAITYSANPTWLHRDTAVLPTAPRARAAWNYRLRTCDANEDGVLVSYWMNRLQHLDGDDLLVTLHPDGWVDSRRVDAAMTYRHPVFTNAALAAATRLRTAGGPRLAFAGAHLGWGFHEDGCRSGVEAAARFGVTW